MRNMGFWFLTNLSIVMCHYSFLPGMHVNTHTDRCRRQTDPPTPGPHTHWFYLQLSLVTINHFPIGPFASFSPDTALISLTWMWASWWIGHFIYICIPIALLIASISEREHTLCFLHIDSVKWKSLHFLPPVGPNW